MNQEPHSLPVVLHLTPLEIAESDCACMAPQSQPDLVRSSPAVFHSREGRLSDNAESDCACASPFTMLSGFSADTGGALWRRTPELHMTPLTGSWTLVFNPLRPEAVTVLNLAARNILDSFVRPRSLTAEITAPHNNVADQSRQAILKFVGLGLLEPLNKPILPSLSTPGVLTVWLQITNACNLRCTYCYVHKTDEAMDEATGLAAVDVAIRSALHHGFRVVKIKYAGGEPSLNFRLVQRLHHYASDQAAVHALSLQEVILSNGVSLTGPMLDFIRDAGIKLMISLDGLGAEHDDQRPLLSGAPSTIRVQRAIQRACERGLRPYVSITVSPTNVVCLADTVRFVLDYNLLFNLNFLRSNAISNRPEKVWAGREQELAAGLLQALAVVEERLPRTRLIDGLLDRTCFTGPHSLPCGAGHNYLAIGPRGQIASCHMVLNRPINDIWWNKDPVNMLHQDGTRPRAVAVEERAICSTCLWRYVCAGGCPLLANLAEYEHDVPSLYCKVYQAVLPKLLRLEGLRLLRWQVRPEE